MEKFAGSSQDTLQYRRAASLATYHTAKAATKTGETPLLVLARPPIDPLITLKGGSLASEVYAPQSRRSSLIKKRTNEGIY